LVAFFVAPIEQLGRKQLNHHQQSNLCRLRDPLRPGEPRETERDEELARVLVSLLSHRNASIVYQAVNAFHTFPESIFPEADAEMFVDVGAVPALVALLEHPLPKLQAAAFKTVARFSKEAASFRDAVLEHDGLFGILRPLAISGHSCHSCDRAGVMGSLSALGGLFKHRRGLPLEKMQAVLPLLAPLFGRYSDDGGECSCALSILSLFLGVGGSIFLASVVDLAFLQKFLSLC
jgi:hypothetical protein